jgi:hypothetical protein
LVGVEFLFSSPINATVAQSVGDYQVSQLRGNRFRALPVLSAGYNSSNNSVLITVGGFKSNKPAQATITGLVGANGAAIPAIQTGL